MRAIIASIVNGPPWVKLRPASSGFYQPHGGSASKADLLLFRGSGPASWSSSPTQEDDHGDSSANDVLNAAERALEQGQAHRPEATVAANMFGRSVPDCRWTEDPRLGHVQSGDRQQTAGCDVVNFGSRTSHRRICGRSRNGPPEEDRSAGQVRIDGATRQAVDDYIKDVGKNRASFCSAPCDPTAHLYPAIRAARRDWVARIGLDRTSSARTRCDGLRQH